MFKGIPPLHTTCWSTLDSSSWEPWWKKRRWRIKIKHSSCSGLLQLQVGIQEDAGSPCSSSFLPLPTDHRFTFAYTMILKRGTASYYLLFIFSFSSNYHQSSMLSFNNSQFWWGAWSRTATSCWSSYKCVQPSLKGLLNIDNCWDSDHSHMEESVLPWLS